MLRSFHNPCLSQVLGHKSSAVSATNLFGYFDPAIGVMHGVGIIMNDWANQIQDINLAHVNAMQGCFSDSYPSCDDPKHFLFNGLDNYISGGNHNEYSSSQTPLILASSWTFSSWIKGLSTDFVHILLSEYLRDAYFSLERSNGVNVIKCRYGLNVSATAVTETLTIPSSIDISKWNQITITQSSNSAKFYINGNYVGTKACGVSYSSNYVLIGRYNVSNPIITPSNWTSAGIKLGHVLIYTSPITNSEDRQNFNAIYQIKSNRIYGATYNA